MDPSDILTPADTAKLLKVSELTLARWRGRGIGPASYRLGHRTIRYMRPEIEAWIHTQTPPHAPKPSSPN